jgi:hypothetical protein
MTAKAASKRGAKAAAPGKAAPDKAIAVIKDIARAHGPDAIAHLWSLARTAESETVQIAACKEILDRGYGKTAQLAGGELDAAAIKVINEVRNIIIDHKKP